MTPQLQQAIRLLQFNNLELAAYVEQEIEQNPLLERDDDPAGQDEGVASEDSAEATDDIESDGLAAIDFTTPEDQGLGSGDAMDVDYDNLWNNDSPGDSNEDGFAAGPAFFDHGQRGASSFDEQSNHLEETLTDELSLRDHLTNQLNLDLEDPVDRMIGVHLIDQLDESGYVTGPLDGVAEILNCEIGQVEAVLAKLQTFDPPGIFARGLMECLAIQLLDRNRLDPAMELLLGRLDLVAKQDVGALVSLCGVDAGDVSDMIDEIRALNPKPAMAFDYEVSQPVVPDVLMRARANGGWTIELNNDTLPRVLINNQYYAHISRTARNDTEKQYISGCYHSASWLVKSLHQRATTILKVATEIVRQQEGFFVNGVQHLRPLVLRNISDAIEMHESTVSRVTSNKYMATPRGIYELKYFFSPAISGALGGGEHSAESVRHRIIELVERETTKNVLSDDNIVAVLRSEGVDIARRTVAKYREAQGIPSSVQRRREKKRRS